MGSVRVSRRQRSGGRSSATHAASMPSTIQYQAIFPPLAQQPTNTLNRKKKHAPRAGPSTRWPRPRAARLRRGIDRTHTHHHNRYTHNCKRIYVYIYQHKGTHPEPARQLIGLALELRDGGAELVPDALLLRHLLLAQPRELRHQPCVWGVIGICVYRG